jgi:3-hydroxyisobutyrate dehydrogenase-like beta-hydroxyacid dehydrogenase
MGLARLTVETNMQVGFIGLGRMGSGMAANLLKAGYEVAIFNRTRAKCAALAERGARVADCPAEACRGEVVFTMLADDAALESVVYGDGGMLASLAQGAIHISSSSISVALSQRLAGAHAGAGQYYIAAPVFGRPDQAAEGKLYAVAAGAADALEIVAPLLDAIAQRTFVVSQKPEAANLIKLSGNFLIASVIESLGEAMALVGKAGIDKRAYLEILTSTLFDVPLYKNFGRAIAEGRFEPAAFAAPLGLKDMRLTLEAGENLRVPLPLASLLRDRFLTLLAHGGDTLDWSAIGGLPARDAGDMPN